MMARDDIIRQEKRNSVVETILTVVILTFTAIQIPLSNYYASLSNRLKILLGATIIVVYATVLRAIYKINRKTIQEVWKNAFFDEDLSAEVEK